jgi:hypothetical protein
LDISSLSSLPNQQKIVASLPQSRRKLPQSYPNPANNILFTIFTWGRPRPVGAKGDDMMNSDADATGKAVKSRKLSHDLFHGLSPEEFDSEAQALAHAQAMTP